VPAGCLAEGLAKGTEDPFEVSGNAGAHRSLLNFQAASDKRLAEHPYRLYQFLGS
jgi:hypothetical protein